MSISAAKQKLLPYSFGSLAFLQARLLCYLASDSITLCEEALNLGLMTNRRLILLPASYVRLEYSAGVNVKKKRIRRFSK